MNNNLLSVIVPVYNVVNSLNRCIESIVSQTYRNIEVILVDDGSTDGSRKICEEWQLRDKRILLSAPKQNGGLSDARNLGVSMSKGKYITFIDSDDFMENTMCERMLNVLISDKSDIVICNYWNYYVETEKKIHSYTLKNSCMSSDETLEKMALGKLPTAAWGKIIKREVLFTDYGKQLCFPVGRRYEDTVMTFRQVVNVKKVSIVEDTLYYYVQNSKGISANPKPQDISDLCKNADELNSLLKDKIPNGMIACYLCGILVYALQICNYLDYDIKKQELKRKINELTLRIPLSVALKSSNYKKIILCKLRIIDFVLEIVRQ